MFVSSLNSKIQTTRFFLSGILSAPWIEYEDETSQNFGLGNFWFSDIDPDTSRWRPIGSQKSYNFQ